MLNGRVISVSVCRARLIYLYLLKNLAIQSLPGEHLIAGERGDVCFGDNEA